MAEKFELEFDDSAITAALARVQQSLEATDDKFTELQKSGEKSTDELADAAKNLDKRLEEVSDTAKEYEATIKKKSEAEKEGAKSSQLQGDAMKVLDSALGGVISKTQASLVAAKAYLVQLRASAKATWASARANIVAAKGTGSFSGAMKLLIPVLKAGGKAMLGIPIFALIAAITAVITYLTRFQGGMDKLAKVMAQAGAVIDVIIDRIAMVGEAIVKVFKGDFAGAAESASASVAGVGDQIRDVTKAVGELQDARVALREEMISNIQLEGKLTRTIEEQKSLSEDVTKTEEERLAAAEKALDAVNQLYDIQVNRATEYARILKAEGQQTKSNADAREAIERAEAEVSQLQAERAARQNELRNARNAIEAEGAARRLEAHKAEQDRVAKLREEYEKLSKQLSDQSQAARLKLLDVIDRAMAEREIAVAAVEKMRQDILDAAVAAGVKPPEDLQQQIDLILKGIEATFEKAVRDNRGDISVIEKLVLGDERTISAEAVNRFAANTTETLQQGLIDAEERLTPYLARFRKFVGESLGLSDEEVQLAFDFIGEAAASITDFTRQQTQARIDMYAAEADALRASRDEIRNELEAEREEQKMGNANRVDELEARLQAEEAALFAAEKRRLEAERKAANQRLVFDSIQQASKLALAAASVINAEAKNGLLGIILAAGGIALLFSIMAGAKANAAKASQIPKLRKGGELRGKSHEDGGIPMVVDGQLVAEAEGGEFVVNRKTTKRHKGFISELNAGKYDHLDRLTVVDPTRQHKQNIRIVNPTRNHLSGMAQQIRAYETKGVEGGEAVVAALMEKAYKAAAKDATSELINYWKGRPVVRPLDGWVETWEVGSTKQRKVVRKG